MACHNKTLYEFYKSNGICVRCGQEKAEKNRVKCSVCLSKDVLSQKRRRERIRKDGKAQQSDLSVSKST